MVLIKTIKIKITVQIIFRIITLRILLCKIFFLCTHNKHKLIETHAYTNTQNNNQTQPKLQNTYAHTCVTIMTINPTHTHARAHARVQHTPPLSDTYPYAKNIHPQLHTHTPTHMPTHIYTHMHVHTRTETYRKNICNDILKHKHKHTNDYTHL